MGYGTVLEEQRVDRGTALVSKALSVASIEGNPIYIGECKIRGLRGEELGFSPVYRTGSRRNSPYYAFLDEGEDSGKLWEVTQIGDSFTLKVLRAKERRGSQLW